MGKAESGRAAHVNPGYRRDEMARGYGAHVAFEVDDLEAAMHHLRAHDVEIVGGPRPRGDGVQQLYICDPDGYIIELFVWNIWLCCLKIRWPSLPEGGGAFGALSRWPARQRELIFCCLR